MRSSNIIILVIVLIAILFGVLFFVINVSEETKKDIIDPDKYDKNGDGFVSNDPFSDDGQCKREFNNYWFYSDALGKCV